VNILSNEPTFDGNGRIVRVQLGARTFAAHIEDVEAKAPAIRITDEASTLLVEIPSAFRQQILKAARAA
jgi:hypothetical protein